MHLNPIKVGLAIGAFAGLVHLGWSALVALNLGQGLMDFIFNLHMINPLYTVEPFSLGIAASLVVVAAVMGFVIGSGFAIIWNRLHRA